MLFYLLSISEEKTKPNIVELYSAYKEPLLQITIKCLQDAGDSNYISDAQDVVQNVFVKTARYINTFPHVSENEQKVYLYAILRNELSDYIATFEKLKNESYDLPDVADDEDFIEALEVRERYNEVVDAIYSLDEKYSTVLLFRYSKGFSVKKIAQVLGVDRAVVYSRLRKGKALLLKELKYKEKD